ncbi:AI-2E family transporter [Deinococcus sonorensis]|uniref:AI-2E family transporter n=2 Tax=Deinococcus sonorensis TaxID=309891 RepID=A0AAU7UDC9_9DEIO
MSPSRRDTAFQYVWRSPWVRTLVFLLAIYLVYRLVGQVTHVIVLGLIAYVIAYLAHPLLRLLEQRRIQRGVGVALVVLLILGLVALASTLLVTVVSQFYTLIQQLPELTTKFLGWFQNLAERFTFLSPTSEQLQKLTQNGATTIQKYLLPYIGRYQGQLVGGVFSVASFVAEMFAVLILSIYMMLDYEKIGLTLLRIFPRTWQPFVLDLSANVGTAVGGYLKGQLLIAAFVGIFVWIGLTIGGIPSAAAIGFLAGLFNIVPYLGVVIAITPALLLAVPAGGLIKIAIVVVVFVLANQIEGHFLSPIVLGRTTNLHPVTVVLAILTGLTMMGITGALLAVPLAALGKLLLQEYYYPSRVYRDGP